MESMWRIKLMRIGKKLTHNSKNYENGKNKPLGNKTKMYIHIYAAATAKSLQSCPTLCDPIDGSPLGSSVPGILQARILEWVAIHIYN